MRRVLRPVRLGALGACLLVVGALVAAPSAARADRLLARMTLAEKIGQMTQAERGAVTDDPSLIAPWRLGALLSGGGSTPNTPEAWADMVDAFQAQAL